MTRSSGGSFSLPELFRAVPRMEGPRCIDWKWVCRAGPRGVSRAGQEGLKDTLHPNLHTRESRHAGAHAQPPQVRTPALSYHPVHNEIVVTRINQKEMFHRSRRENSCPSQQPSWHVTPAVAPRAASPLQFGDFPWEVTLLSNQDKVGSS